MNWLSYLFPRTITRASSPYNRDIRVVMENGRKKLLVNGIQQSGPMIEGFWMYAFSHVELPEVTRVQTILVLGVGGGSVIHMLHARYPGASLTGVDIDERIIAIGRKYFGLSGITPLKLVTSDASEYVQKDRKKYDLIIVDLYIGRMIPEFESSEQFVRHLRARITPGGSVLFNFLHDGAFEQRSEGLYTILKKQFSRVSRADLPYNRFFLAR